MHNQGHPKDMLIRWKQWDLPRNEGTRLHEFGDVIICVAVDLAGNGEILETIPIYPAHDVPIHKKTGVGPGITLPALSDPSWTRFYLGKENDYEIMPAYPPMPTCVRIKEPFSLPPGTTLEGWIFSRIEACIRVGDTVVASYPLAPPVKTLYGTPDAGVVCRYDEAEFLASSEPVLTSFHDDPRFVAHPVRLKNTSSAPVLVSELCIYGEQLSIISVGSKMQSEKLLFIFSSSGVRMSLDGQGLLPPGATTIAKPLVSGEERFIVRSFELFKTMTRI
jgi:hypothetical protein